MTSHKVFDGDKQMIVQKHLMEAVYDAMRKYLDLVLGHLELQYGRWQIDDGADLGTKASKQLFDGK